MGFQEKRRLIRVGDTSRAVIVPKSWADYHGEDVDEVTLLGDNILIVAPRGQEEKAKQVLKQVESVLP